MTKSIAGSAAIVTLCVLTACSSAKTEVMPPTRAVTLPALRVAMRDLVANIARHAGTSAGTVRYKPDHDLESVFGAYPPLATEVAEALGFASDGELSTLVATVLAAL